MNREWKSDKLEYSNTDEPTNLTTSFERENLTTIVENRVAEVVRGHGGPSPKSLDLDENFKH